MMIPPVRGSRPGEVLPDCPLFLIGTEKVKVTNYFEHRDDMLQTRTETSHNGQSLECFGPGRQWGLKGM